jgi:Zn-dependent protease/CBS domain-containing protein
MVLLFACVTLHELGHALAAQYFGIRVRNIVLLPIGGVALLSRPTRRPIQELVIAAAGPAVNVAILAMLAPVLLFTGEPVAGPRSLLDPAGTSPSIITALHWLFGANVGLVLFNLIPAFPLDGGRILRALLGLMMPWVSATRWATRVGQALAATMSVYAMVRGEPMLAIVSVLVFFAAASQQAEEDAYVTLTAHPTASATKRTSVALAQDDAFDVVVRHLLTAPHADVPVLRGRHLVGVIRRADVLRALASGRRTGSAGDLMVPMARVASTDSLASTLATLQHTGLAVATVWDDDTFVGLVSRDDIATASVMLAGLVAPASAPPFSGPSFSRPRESTATS